MHHRNAAHIRNAKSPAARQGIRLFPCAVYALHHGIRNAGAVIVYAKRHTVLRKLNRHRHVHLFSAVPQAVGHKRQNGSAQQVRIRLHLLIALRRNHANFRMPFQLLAQIFYKGRNAALLPLHAFRRTGEQFQMADAAQYAIRLPPNFRRNIRLLQLVQPIRLNEQVGCAVAQIRRRQGDARRGALRFRKYQHRPAFHRYDTHVPLSAIE